MSIQVPSQSLHPVLPTSLGAQIPTKDQRTRTRPQQLDQPSDNLRLLYATEQMEKATQVDHVHGAVPVRQEGLVEHVARPQFGVEAVPVTKELVAEVQEMAFEVGAVQVRRGAGVEGGFAEVLPETAAEVKEGLATAKTGHDGRVKGREVDAEVEKAEDADTGVWQAAERRIVVSSLNGASKG